MQITFIISKTMLLLIILNVSQCSFAQTMETEHSNNTKVNQSVENFQENYYKALKITCTKADSCYVITYVESKFFNRTDLTEIAKTLSKEFEKKKGLTLWLFDDFDLAESFASGKREYTNIFSDIRGKYVRGGNEEFLIFSVNKKKLGDSKNVIRINFKGN